MLREILNLLIHVPTGVIKFKRDLEDDLITAYEVAKSIEMGIEVLS